MAAHQPGSAGWSRSFAFLPCDVAPGHLEVVKGAEAAGAMLEGCKVNSFYFFEDGFVPWTKFILRGLAGPR